MTTYYATSDATLASAMSSATTGDTILCTGTFSPFTISKAITVQADTGGATVSGGTIGIGFSADNATVDGFSVTGGSQHGIYAYQRTGITILDCLVHDTGGAGQAGIYLRECHDALVQDCVVRNVDDNGLYFVDCYDSTMLDNEVDATSYDGISLSGWRNIADGNYVHGMTSGTNHGDGIIVACPEVTGESADTEDTILRNNIIGDCTQYIYVDAYNYSNATVRRIVNTEIHGNILRAGDAASGYIHQGIVLDSETEDIVGMSIHNNTIYKLGLAGTGNGQAIRMAPRSGFLLDTVSIVDNIFVDSGITRQYDTTNLTLDYNLYHRTSSIGQFYWQDPTSAWYDTLAQFQAATTGYEDNAYSGDPLFADASAYDFTLIAGSPALGTASDGGDIGALGAAVTWTIERRVV